MSKPVSNNAGQHYFLQINKVAEDILYPRFGKMAWGIGSVYLRLKKCHAADGKDNTLWTGEVEEDLNLEDILETSLNLREGGDKGELIDVVIHGEASSARTETPANKSP